ncbi:hypothetical protein WN943_021623 [Citrus x changshan-huyou]
MHKVLHVGPDTCSVVSTLLKEEETEAWGVEPYDIEDADARCKSLVHKGIVRVADIKFPLPYRAKSFPLVIVSDALDYLSPKYLNKTLPDLARVASDGVLIFAGYPGQQRAKVAELSKFGRPAKMRSSSWWIRYFVQTSLEENEPAMKKFEQAASKKSYKPNCQYELKLQKMFYTMSNARLTPVIDVVRLKKDGISQLVTASALVGLNSTVPQYSVIPNW